MTLRISNDLAEFDLPMIHGFLSQQSYWAQDIPLATVQRALQNSLCFGGFLDDQQIAFARVTTDKATFAYLADVFVLPEWRGQGHSKTLIEFILQHRELQGLRRFMLATGDAHALYARFGFKPPAKPEALMEINRPGLYRRA
ncbi:MAG: GNAT family N-acetyltransferase [Burkholderiales bacterium]|nr:GNAT family N-acetyltransferase [Burkholderiales bacterium]